MSSNRHKLMILENKPDVINTNSPEYIKLLEILIKTIRKSGADFIDNDNDDDFEPTLK